MPPTPETPPDPTPADASGAENTRGFTVKRLKETLGEMLPHARKLIAAVFASWPGPTPCDARWLVLVNARWESIRQRTVHGAATSNALQATHHAITEAVGPLLGPLAARALAALTWEERLPRLRSLLNFALRPNERALLDFLERGRPEDAAQRVQARAQAVQELGQRLNLAGALSTGLPGQGEFAFALEMEEADAEGAFGRAIVQARQTAGITQAELAKRVGLLPQNLCRYEKNLDLPSRASLGLVLRLVAELKAPQILAAFQASRNLRDRQKPRCLRNDVRLWDYVSPAHRDQFAAFLAYENSREHVPRRGKRDSGGKLAANSCKGYGLLFRQVLSSLQLPSDHPDPRCRGLGLTPTEVSILDLTHVPFLEFHFQRHHLRNGRETFARCDAMMVGKLIDLCSEEGYIYMNAERLAGLVPAASLARCPSVWPEGSERPGATCQSGAERIRARCRETRRALAPWRRTAANAAPSAQHLRRLAPLLAQQTYPLDALMEIFHRHHRRISRTRAEAFTMLTLALLALQCWRPRRPEEFGRIRLEDLVLGADGQTSALSRPKKNSDSLRARQQVFTALPPELAQPVRDYLEHARPLLCPGTPSARDRAFCNREGGPLSAQTVGVLLQQLVAALAPDLFPMGLNPHAVRTIVATDLVLRFGLKVGIILAAEALIDHASTTLTSYIIHTPVSARQQAGDKTQEAAVAAAYRAVCGHKFKATPLKP